MSEEGVKQSGIFNEGLQGPAFKPWMRVIAGILIFCFIHQDIAQAMGPDLASTVNSLLRPSAPISKPLDFSSLLSIQRVYGAEGGYYGGVNLGGGNTYIDQRTGQRTERPPQYQPPPPSNPNPQPQQSTQPSCTNGTCQLPRSSTPTTRSDPAAQTRVRVDSDALVANPSARTLGEGITGPQGPIGPTGPTGSPGIPRVGVNPEGTSGPTGPTSQTEDARLWIAAGGDRAQAQGIMLDPATRGQLRAQVDAKVQEAGEWHDYGFNRWAQRYTTDGDSPLGHSTDNGILITGVGTGSMESMVSPDGRLNPTYLVRAQANGAFYATTSPELAGRAEAIFQSRYQALVEQGELRLDVARTAALYMALNEMGVSGVSAPNPEGAMARWNFTHEGTRNTWELTARGNVDELRMFPTAVSQDGGAFRTLYFRGDGAGSLGFDNPNPRVASEAFSIRYASWFRNNPEGGFAYSQQDPGLRAYYYTAPFRDSDGWSRPLYIEKYTYSNAGGTVVLGHVLGNPLDGREFSARSTYSFDNQYFHPFRNYDNANLTVGCGSCGENITRTFQGTGVMGFAPIKYADDSAMANRWVPMDQAFGQFVKGQSGSFTYTSPMGAGDPNSPGSPYKIFVGPDLATA